VELPLEPEVDVAKGVSAGVVGPHTFELLSHRLLGAFHCPSPDASTAGRNCALAIAVGKDFKEVDRVPHFKEPGVNAQGDAECLPDEPLGIVGGGS
jgi:hypothetical protein